MRERKSFPLLIFLAALIFFPVTNVMAGTDYLFGPIEYRRTTTKAADIYAETFSATPGEARLVVENGDGAGRWGIEGARIIVNGKEIIAPDDFSSGCMYPSCKMVKLVLLTSDNTISIELTEGKKNSRMTVYIVRAPSVSIDADPKTIDQGDATVLTWASFNADSIRIEPGIYNGADPKGSIEVRPSETTVYTVTAVGSGLSSTDAVTVTVNPVMMFDATPSPIRPNGMCTLAWTAPGADYCVINPDIGGFGPNGTIDVELSETTTFAIMAFGPDGISTDTVTVDVEGPPLPTVSINAGRQSICESHTYPNTLTWSTTDADSCIIEPDIGSVGPSGSIDVSPTQTKTYTITASNPEGSASKSLTVYVCESPPPVASLSADPYVIYKGGRTYLTWSATNTSSGGCRLTPGNFITNGYLWHYSFHPSETTTYTVTASGPGGTDAVSVLVVVIDPPEVTLTADPADVLPNQSTILTWNSPDGGTCRIEPGIGMVGSSGSMEVWPTETTTYTITVDGPIGPYHKTVQVSIIPPAVSIEADPKAILPGGKSMLSWTATNADTCAIEPDIGDVDVNGSIEVSPEVDTRYTIRATNIGGTATGYADVHIIEPPTASIWASGGAVIQPGGTTSLTWKTTDADFRLIEPDIGSVGPSGTLSNVSPAETTQYTITATGPLGTAADSCVVGVAHSSETTVFGPNPYNRTKGKADLYTESFSASPGPGRLIIKNGAETGGSRITDATILLNGVEIFSPSDFGASIHYLGKNVALGPGNTLSITLKKGEKNSYLTINVIQDQFPTVNIGANPITVVNGDESLLSWTSTNAYICRITPDISNVMPNGTISVAPVKTTTYTITATGSGGAATDSITITVVDPPPVVDIAADPELIKPGESSLLTWTTQNANSCTIEPGIGAVGPAGSIEVSPMETTTYTITATEAGGAASRSVTVTVDQIPEPSVSLTAEPVEIFAGEWATLSWNSTEATEAVIDHGVGPVPINGSIMVSPGETTVYTITVTGPGGTNSASAMVSLISPISLQIIHPTNGETISSRDVIVTGSVVNLNGNETGIIVGGLPANVYDGHFFVNHFPLVDGENTILVVAMDSTGAQIQREILVNAVLPSDYIHIHAAREAGLAPMETELYVTGSFSPDSPAVINCDGPASMTLIESGIDRFKVGFDAPGIYSITAAATDGTGLPFTDTIMLLVMDPDVMNALLSSKWNGMLDSLGRGDAVAASSYFVGNVRDRYAANFDLLKDHLPEIVSGLQDMRLVTITENEAEYSALGVQGDRTFSFYVLFVKDGDGIWRIRFF